MFTNMCQVPTLCQAPNVTQKRVTQTKEDTEFAHGRRLSQPFSEAYFSPVYPVLSDLDFETHLV